MKQERESRAFKVTKKVVEKMGRPLMAATLLVSSSAFYQPPPAFSEKPSRPVQEFPRVKPKDVYPRVARERIEHGEVDIAKLKDGPFEIPISLQVSQEPPVDPPAEEPEEPIQEPEPEWPYFKMNGELYVAVGGGDVNTITGYYCEYIPGYPKGDGGGFCGKTRMATPVRPGVAACGADFQLGSLIFIEGDTEVLTCEDTGNLARKQVDVFYSTNRDLYYSHRPTRGRVFVVAKAVE